MPPKKRPQQATPHAAAPVSLPTTTQQPGASTSNPLDPLADIEQYPEAHRNDIEATYAIYPEDFERVHGKKAAWRVRYPPIQV